MVKIKFMVFCITTYTIGLVIYAICEDEFGWDMTWVIVVGITIFSCAIGMVAFSRRFGTWLYEYVTKLFLHRQPVNKQLNTANNAVGEFAEPWAQKAIIWKFRLVGISIASCVIFWTVVFAVSYPPVIM